MMLGDIGDIKDPKVIELLSKLNGCKILILGNHDKYSVESYKPYFEEVYEFSVFAEERIVFSHRPVKVEKGILNVHGHTHFLKLESINHINMCPENWDFKTVSYKKIEKTLETLEMPNYKFLEEWFCDILVLSPKGNKYIILKGMGLVDARQL